jgi:type I restriction enzyme S subunit
MNGGAHALGNLTKVITKGTTPTTLGFNFVEHGIPFVRAQNLRDGTVDPEIDPLFITEDTHRALARSMIAPGDVLISIAGTIGRVGVVPSTAIEMNCNQAVAIVRPKAELHNRFLFHWLQSAEAHDQINKSQVTGTISNLSLAQIGEFKILLPSLNTQRRIAVILDQVDELRRKRQQALNRLEALTWAIFHEMFGEPDINPNKYPVEQFGDLIVDGPTNGLYKHASAYGEGTRILRINNFYDGQVMNLKELRRVKISEKEMKVFKLEEDNIVINRVNSREFLGKSALIPHLDEAVVFESNMMRIGIDKRRLDGIFCISLLQTPFIKKQIDRSAKDAVNQSSINQSDCTERVIG